MPALKLRPSRATLRLSWLETMSKAFCTWDSLQITRQGAGRMDGVNSTERTDFRESKYYWLNITRHQHPEAPDTETQVVTQGGISVTPLEFDRTAIALREQLHAAVKTV